jgi:three-Cys-motif partner protein
MVNDLLLCNPAERWTKQKFDLLRKYLPAYTRIVSKNFFRAPFYYIDAFAGSGKDKIKSTGEIIDGSPLIALNVEPSFTNYVLIESDDRFFNALTKRVQKHSKSNSTQLVHDDCNVCIDNVLGGISVNAPIFAFLDPYGLELSWQTVEKLAKRRHVDFLITFMTMGVWRCAFNRRTWGAVDNFYGIPTWRGIMQERKKKRLSALHARRAFVDLYKSQLKKLLVHVEDLVLVRDRQGRPLYHMIFASNYDVAVKIARDISNTGTLRKFFKR